VADFTSIALTYPRHPNKRLDLLAELFEAFSIFMWRIEMAGFKTSRTDWLSHVASVAAVAFTFGIGLAQSGAF